MAQLVKGLLRYGEFSIFQNGGGRHLGFLNFKILMVGRVKRVKIPHSTKFGGDRLTVAEIRRYFSFSKWRPPHLGQ